MSQLIQADSTATYSPNEAAVIVVAAAWVIAVGGLALAAIYMCGWGHVRSATMNFWKGQANITCK